MGLSMFPVSLSTYLSFFSTVTFVCLCPFFLQQSVYLSGWWLSVPVSPTMSDQVLSTHP